MPCKGRRELEDLENMRVSLGKEQSKGMTYDMASALRFDPATDEDVCEDLEFFRVR